jgi:hypothetical protein
MFASLAIFVLLLPTSSVEAKAQTGPQSIDSASLLTSQHVLAQQRTIIPPQTTTLSTIAPGETPAPSVPDSTSSLATAPSAPVFPVSVQPSARTRKRLWLALIVTQHSAATFDAWATRTSVRSGNGQEMDPFLEPVANSRAIYPVIQIVPAVLDLLGHRMAHSPNRVLQRLWWVPQSAASAGFIFSGVHNLRVAK